MALSPMVQHYRDTKEKYNDCIVFYRLGDFYEMFDDDAIKVSKLLDLTLTGKSCGLPDRIPMCGVPYHAAEGYIAKLVGFGEKVAICEQLTAPSESKGLVERDVVRVITAGTLTDEHQLDAKKNNFIACVYENDKGYGISWADITTGVFYTANLSSQSKERELLDNLTRINPSEIICNERIYLKSTEFSIVKHGVVPKFSLYNGWAFEPYSAEKSIKEQFNVLTLKPYNIEGNKLAISACGGLLEYLKETQKHALINFTKIEYVAPNSFLSLDNTAIRNLELIKSNVDGKKYGTLLYVLDKTETGMGARMLSSFITMPLIDEKKILYRQEGVKQLFENTLFREGIKDLLSSFGDLERLIGKVSNGNVSPKDCLKMGESLALLPSIKMQLVKFSAEILSDISNNLVDESSVAKLLLNIFETKDTPATTKNGGFVKEGFSKEIDELRDIKKNGAVHLRQMEAKEREETGIKNLKIAFNRVFGYYIEVTNSYKDLVPLRYQRKQTLANAERYVTEELKELEEKILSAEERILKAELEIFDKVKSLLSSKIVELKQIAENIGLLDVLVSLAKVAKENNYVQPSISKNNKAINIVGGRHPVVECINKNGFVSNDTYLNSGDSRTMIITGPNMAGKSTYMRQVALISLMAHIGSFVPCTEAEIPILDKIFTRVGANDNLILDQSTFMVEMSEVATILLNATENSLIIFDEVGRGTSTYDGLSIAWAIIEYTNNIIKSKTLFSTHYHELTDLENSIEGIKNYKITVKETKDGIVFLRKIVQGGANKSFGIEVASLAGVPKVVTNRAKEILKGIVKLNVSGLENIESNQIDNEYEKYAILDEIKEKLSNLDVESLTPIKALQILDELSTKCKDIKED